MKICKHMPLVPSDSYFYNFSFEFHPQINFVGRTGNVRFLKTGYREVTDLEACEIKDGGKIEKVGLIIELNYICFCTVRL